MIRTSIFSTLFVLFAIASKAQLGKYNVLFIPDSLRKSADAVLREDDVVFTVKDIGTATLKAHYVVTILNESDKQDLTFAKGSDKFDYLDEAEIIVYDAMGSKIKAYSKKDMQTAAFGQGLVEDGKTTYFSVTAATYPITIEQNYTVKFKGILNYPNYYIANYGHAVQSGSFEAIVPNELGLRYKPLNTTLQPQINNDGQKTSYKWSITNVKAQHRESFSGPTNHYLPIILMGPNKFQMDDYAGDMSSWKNFGDWTYHLIGTANQLSPARIDFYKNMVKVATTDRQKAEIIYHYLQQNMRYVSIQLGIGGWKPFPASFVDEKKYGDCKALSNYMQATLAAVGVKSYYAIVNAGTNGEPAMDDFPASYFNHIILCIPQPKDSIWLECTSKLTDFGVLGDFTENRKALLVTENGGVLVQTPASKPQENVFACHADILLNADGSAKVSSNIFCKGEYKFGEVSYMNQRTEDEKRAYFIRNLEWKQPDVLTISTGERSETPYRTNATMSYEQIYNFKAGSKMFLPLRMYPIFSTTIPATEKRKLDYYFDHPYQLFDTTTYHLPDGFGVENLPKEKKLETSFGKYTNRCVYDETAKTVTIIAFLEISHHIIPATNYADLLAFKKYLEEDMGEKLVVKAN